MYVCINGKFVHEEKAKIPALDNGFLYGDGIYDTMRSYNSRILEIDLHMKRIEKSVKYIGIYLPFSIDKIKEWTQRLIKINKLNSGRVRVSISRGLHGFDFIKKSKGTLVISCEKLILNKKDYTHGVSAITMKLQRILPEIKTIGLTHMIKAYRYAASSKAYEVILIDDKNFVREGASTNIFLVKKGALYTPRNKILKGLTRHRIILLAKKLGLKVIIKDFKKNLLYKADEIFLTNRPRGIIPVIKIDDVEIGKKRVGFYTNKIISAYREYTQHACQ